MQIIFPLKRVFSAKRAQSELCICAGTEPPIHQPVSDCEFQINVPKLNQILSVHNSKSHRQLPTSHIPISVSCTSQPDSFLSTEIQPQISTSLFIFNSLFRKIKTVTRTSREWSPAPFTQQTPKKSSLPLHFLFHHSYVCCVWKYPVSITLCEGIFNRREVTTSENTSSTEVSLSKQVSGRLSHQFNQSCEHHSGSGMTKIPFFQIKAFYLPSDTSCSKGHSPRWLSTVY